MQLQPLLNRRLKRSQPPQLLRSLMLPTVLWQIGGVRNRVRLRKSPSGNPARLYEAVKFVGQSLTFLGCLNPDQF